LISLDRQKRRRKEKEKGKKGKKTNRQETFSPFPLFFSLFFFWSSSEFCVANYFLYLRNKKYLSYDTIFFEKWLRIA